MSSVPDPTSPIRQTFIERAAADLKSFQSYIDQEAWFYKETRQTVMNLLTQTLNDARMKGYDDDLYTTYVLIKSFAEQHWFYTKPFLSAIEATMNAINQRQVIREQSDNGRLADQNRQLHDLNTRLRESERLALMARDTQRQVAEDKSRAIQIKDQTIMKLTDAHSKLVAELAGTNKRLTDLQARLDDHFKDCPSHTGKSPDKKPGDSPDIMGSSAARDEEKPYQRPSPKKPGWGFFS